MGPEIDYYFQFTPIILIIYVGKKHCVLFIGKKALWSGKAVNTLSFASAMQG